MTSCLTNLLNIKVLSKMYLYVLKYQNLICHISSPHPHKNKLTLNVYNEKKHTHKKNNPPSHLKEKEWR